MFFGFIASFEDHVIRVLPKKKQRFIIVVTIAMPYGIVS